MTTRTLAWFIEQAISWEIVARDFYLTLARSFPAHPSVQDFWKQMSVDESSHAAILERVRETVEPDRLFEPIGKQETELVAAVEATIAHARAARLVTLGDAYDIAHRLESSEINSVFRLVALDSIDDQSRYELLEKQFDEHIERLVQFGREFDPALRESIVLHDEMKQGHP